jgi:glycosyltransferase involved in cell wall biosynthesis
LSGVLRAIHRFDPDVVHGHYLSTAAGYLTWARGPAIVGSAMGSDLLIDCRAAHARLLVRSLRWTVDRFTSVAPHVTRTMQRLGLPTERIATFPWGVDLSVFHPNTSLPREAIVISTRNFEPVYDNSTLLRAFGRVLKSRGDVRLKLLGGGSQRPVLESLAASASPPGRIEFLGRVRPETLAGHLRDAVLYVSTSLSDGASASLLEGMAVGLLPVVTDIEANRNWIQDGENGLLFAAGDDAALARMILKALEDEPLRERALRENPRLIASRASWGTSMERLHDVYRSAVA